MLRTIVVVIIAVFTLNACVVVPLGWGHRGGHHGHGHGHGGHGGHYGGHGGKHGGDYRR